MRKSKAPLTILLLALLLALVPISALAQETPIEEIPSCEPADPGCNYPVAAPESNPEDVLACEPGTNGCPAPNDGLMDHHVYLPTVSNDGQAETAVAGASGEEDPPITLPEPATCSQIGPPWPKPAGEVVEASEAHYECTWLFMMYADSGVKEGDDALPGAS